MKENVREQLIYTMFESLYHEGYNASNLVDLLKKAGASKGGMYHYFDSKKTLALETLQIVGAGFIEHFWKQEFERHENPIDALECILTKLPHTTIIGDIAFEFQYGCPINNMIQEMSALDEDFKKLLENIVQQWQICLEFYFKEAQHKGYFEASLDSAQIARYIIVVVEGTLTLVKVTSNQSFYDENVKILIHYLRSFCTKSS